MTHKIRIASVSDLHTDYAENRDAIVALCTEIHRKKTDAVIIAGDVSHKDDRIRRAILAFRAVSETVAYIPGNHDLWYDVPFAPLHKELDTWRRYHQELRALVEDAGAHYLPAKPLVLGGIGIAGSCGWYDYSLMLPSIREAVDDRTLASKQLGGVMWSDARLIAFRHENGELMSDPEVARKMEAELAAQLAALDADPSIEEIIAVTHHQPFTDVVHRTGTLPWEFFNAFMGSKGLGEVIAASRKVRTAIYGHTHMIGERVVGGLRVYGTPLGYPRERRGMSEAEMLATRIGWIER